MKRVREGKLVCNVISPSELCAPGVIMRVKERKWKKGEEEGSSQFKEKGGGQHETTDFPTLGCNLCIQYHSLALANT